MRADIIAKFCQGSIIAGLESATASSCSIDSREVKNGALFAAFAGEKINAHDFLPQVFEAGASIALVTELREYEGMLADLNESSSEKCARAVILVDDMLKAVQDLARYQREILDKDVLVVGITGSTGKTSTKEYCAAALEATLGETVATFENQNNELGLPLTILSVSETSKALILEMGMRARGEIEFLSQLARPHLAIITGSGFSHIEILGSAKEIARAKAEIFSGLEAHQGRFAERIPRAFGILPAADEFAELFCSSCTAPSFTVAFADELRSNVADLIIEDVSYDEHNRARATSNLYPNLNLTSKMVGKHQLLNQAFVLAVVHLLGLDAEKALEAMAETELSGMRYRKIFFEPRGLTLINDAYNANPRSMEGALGSFAREKAQRKIAVLGDMLELGSFAEDAHRELGRQAARVGLDCLFVIGDYAPLVVEEAKLGGMNKAEAFGIDNIEELSDRLDEILRAGDMILLKASRALRLERIPERLGL